MHWTNITTIVGESTHIVNRIKSLTVPCGSRLMLIFFSSGRCFSWCLLGTGTACSPETVGFPTGCSYFDRLGWPGLRNVKLFPALSATRRQRRKVDKCRVADKKQTDKPTNKHTLLFYRYRLIIKVRGIWRNQFFKGCNIYIYTSSRNTPQFLQPYPCITVRSLHRYFRLLRACLHTIKTSINPPINHSAGINNTGITCNNMKIKIIP